MNKLPERFLYRAMCVLSLLVTLYLAFNFRSSGTLNYKLIIAFALFILVTIWGIMDWSRNYKLIKRQEEELKMYKLYVQPLEELVREIRTRQHEFDNHLNAVMNMHLTIKNYDELVEAQEKYIGSVVRDGDRKFLPILKISDKVIAGFLYSKVMKAPEYVTTEIQVKSLEIMSGVSESHLIEIIGTLVDNAYEACDREHSIVNISLDSKYDRLVFEIQNEMDGIKLKEVSRYFERGYSTKTTDGSRGLGLYRARMLIEQFGGEITVSMPVIGGREFISFQVII